MPTEIFEGMGCIGGCVGGPKAVLDREEGKRNVDRYGEEASCKTPLENPYVPELLKRLGFSSVEEFWKKVRSSTGILDKYRIVSNLSFFRILKERSDCDWKTD